MKTNRFRFIERQFREETAAEVKSTIEYLDKCSVTKREHRAVIHSRGLVQQMQRAGILPENMSVAKFNATSLAITSLVLELEKE